MPYFRTTILITAALACVACITLPGCGDSTPKAKAPDQVVEDFYARTFANQAKTEDEIKALAEEIKAEFFKPAGEEDKEALDEVLPMVLFAFSPLSNQKVEFTDLSFTVIEEKGSTARVKVTGRSKTTFEDGEEQEKDMEVVYDLVNRDGRWWLARLM